MNQPALIVVLFHPSPEDLEQLRRLAELWPGCIVDNSEEPCFGTPDVGRMHYVCNGENLGIAEAQAIGIRHLLENGSPTHMVMLDQDSRIPDDYPRLIAGQYERIRASHPSLALLGPTLVRIGSGEEYRSAIHRDKPADEGFIERRDVVSTGSCIATDILRRVGLPDSRLFIDYVDYEWCWRAEAKGHVCGITSRLTIGHRVGQRELKLGAYRVIISAPRRYFFQYRNYLWLLRRRYVPLQWKMATGIKFVARLAYFPLLVRGGRRCWHFMWRGIREGLSAPGQDSP